LINTIADSTEFGLGDDVHPDLRIALTSRASVRLAWAASDRDPNFARDMSEYSPA